MRMVGKDGGGSGTSCDVDVPENGAGASRVLAAHSENAKTKAEAGSLVAVHAESAKLKAETGNAGAVLTENSKLKAEAGSLGAAHAENAKLKAELAQALELQDKASKEAHSYLEKLKAANTFVITEQEKYAKVLKEYKKLHENKRHVEGTLQSALRELRITRDENTRQDSFLQQLLREIRRLQDALQRTERAKENLSSKLKGNRGGSSGSLNGMNDKKDRRRRVSGTNATTRNGCDPGILAGTKSSAAESSTGSLTDLNAEESEVTDRVRAIAEEKQRLDEAQELLTWQTEKLLTEKSRLLHAINERDTELQRLQANVDDLENELDLALSERDALIERIRQVAPPEIASAVLAPSSPQPFQFITPEKEDCAVDSSSVPRFADGAYSVAV